MTSYRRLWFGLGLVVIGSFAILDYYGREIYRQAPPVPEQVITIEGDLLFSGLTIGGGQNVWQAMGGQEVGSVLGHGAYVAPDWTADWLHRESVWLLNEWANRDYQMPYEQLDEEAQAALQARLRNELRPNAYDPATGNLVISPLRAQAIAAVSKHYSDLFSDAPELADLHEAYAQ